MHSEKNFDWNIPHCSFVMWQWTTRYLKKIKKIAQLVIMNNSSNHIEMEQTLNIIYWLRNKSMCVFPCLVYLRKGANGNGNSECER
ncbi:hypothetical protein ANTQUA_LOCUS8766 [Anthophora quadrimaculata]